MKGLVELLVKGVNKKVIEINDTGNEVFEKVVLYIKPKYSLLENKELKKEAGEVLKNYSIDEFVYEREVVGSRRLFLILFSSIIAVAVITALIIIF